jgi:hypothetical protein
MAATSIERVRDGYVLLRRAAATGDWEPFLETIHPEIEWFPHDLFPEQEVAHGRDGVKARFKLMWQAKVESLVYQVMRYRDDMLVRLNWYSTQDEALEAAGLKE